MKMIMRKRAFTQKRSHEEEDNNAQEDNDGDEMKPRALLFCSKLKLSRMG